MQEAAITIRKLGPPDLAALLAVPDGIFDRPILPDQAAAVLHAQDHDLVAALAEDTIVGFASGAVLLHPDKPPAYFVAEVGVDDAFQRRGIATRIMATLIEIARARGCIGVWLATEDANGPARALYRKLGARETTGVVVYDWDGAMDDA
jgi:ribosomal protein S18 acetylase RimI-like enzyme